MRPVKEFWKTSQFWANAMITGFTGTAMLQGDISYEVGIAAMTGLWAVYNGVRGYQYGKKE